MPELLLGCGNNRNKQIYSDNDELIIEKEWTDLTTLDIDPGVLPDVVYDLNETALGNRPLPFDDNTFDEIHAYDVLEHLGRQGNYIGFFREFAEYWRILKPSGLFCATVPAWDSVWAWGDPGHTRIISEAHLVYLSQNQYKAQIGKTRMADYRPHWDKNFETLTIEYEADTFGFILQKA